MRFSIFLISIKLIFMLPLSLWAQVTPDSIRASLERHHLKFPGEKIYLHLDKPYYAPGDTIWFKAYVTDAMDHLPDTVSKNIYVDFIRKDNGKLLQNLLIRNNDGFPNAFIALSDSLKDAVYEVRAYTSWMRNFSDSFFQKEVFVKDRFQPKQLSPEEKNEVLKVADLQFFPEGGNLIAGLPNRVSFKAVNKYGRGVDFSAWIVSDKNDTVATVQSQHLGMGSFIFTPAVGVKFVAKIKNQVTTAPFGFPEVRPEGYLLFVDNLSNKDLIKIVIKLNSSGNDRPILIGHQQGKVIFAFQSPKEGKAFSFSLRKSDIPSNGLVHLTLFNGQGLPQCERLIYNGTVPAPRASFLTDKNEYNPKEKITLSINVKDANGEPTQGNFSLSVTDANQVTPEVNSENILSYLQLTSDIKGLIEQPNYYFDKTNPNSLVHLDILLMTQGWRRFTWSEVLTPTLNELQYPIETGITLRGSALRFNGKPAPKPIELSLTYHPDKDQTEFLQVKTDTKGKFVFTDLNVKDEVQAMVQGRKEKGGKDVLIKLDQPASPTFKPIKNLIDPFLLLDFKRERTSDENLKHYIELQSKMKSTKVTELKEVVVSSKIVKEDKRNSLYSGMNFRAFKVDNNNCGTALTVFQLLQGRVPGLMINYAAPPQSSTITFSRKNGTMYGTPPQPAFLLDGFKVDQQTLETITPCSIESIDIITSPVAIYNSFGMISVLTKSANPNYNWTAEPALGVIGAKIRGYNKFKEFYCPKYTKTDMSSDPNPDFRTTVYWNPKVRTDANGNSEVSFWNTGESTTVNVRLEGISRDGKPVFATYEYNVK